MRKYLIILMTLFLTSCKKDCKVPINHLEGKIKSVFITGGTEPLAIYYTYKFNYDSLNNKLRKADLYLRIRDEYTTYYLGYYEINHNSSDLVIKKIGLDYTNPYHKYKAYINNNIISKINELDTITNDEFPNFTYAFSNKIDSVYEPNVFPTAINRSCYDYIFDGNNYTQFKFEYDVVTFSGNSYRVKDTAYITYTNLPFNKYAPIQNMYSSSTLFNVGVPGEVVYDFIYLLGFENYYFYPHNRNLIETIRTVHDSTAIVYFNYEFNAKNNLTKVVINFREPTSRLLMYEFEYY